MSSSSKGFTLIELLIVIGIISILAAVTIVAINPARQFAQSRNTQRMSDVNTILNAVHQNMVDNEGSFECADGNTLPDTATEISNTGADLCDCLVPTYVAEMPVDPQDGTYTDCTSYSTGYEIVQDADGGRVTVSAPSAELERTISVTR